MQPQHILIIKHSALGDMILATAAFAAIRQQFPEAQITLLTTRPYADLLTKSAYFNDIWVDTKPKIWNIAGILNLRRRLNAKPWNWVFDLQCSSRTRRYMHLLHKPWPNISGASAGISHPRPKPDDSIHALKNIQAQLAVAGITAGDLPDITWLTQPDAPPLNVRAPYALMVPGGAAHRPEKRWPAAYYAKLARQLVKHGVTPLLIGTKAETEALDEIIKTVPECVNLCGQTSIAQLADLARGAMLAVGNDTGPMHIIGAAGCPSTVLFSHASDPVRSAPLGEQVNVLRAENLADLSVQTVLAGLTGRA